MMSDQHMSNISQKRLSAYTFFRKREGRSHFTKLIPIAAVLCVVLIAGFLVILVNAFHQTSKAVPQATIWSLQPNQTLIRSDKGIFSIKYISITSAELRFFYAFKSSYKDAPQVNATSYLISAPNNIAHLKVNIESLGQLGDYNVGVIHVDWLNRAVQVIDLSITSQEGSPLIGHITPLKQLQEEPHREALTHGGITIPQNELPEVQWATPVMMEQVAFFKNTVPHQPGPTHIFVKLDDPSKVEIISQAEYLKIAGMENYF